MAPPISGMAAAASSPMVSWRGRPTPPAGMAATRARRPILKRAPRAARGPAAPF